MPDSPFELFVATVLLTWLAMSTLNQFDFTWNESVRRRDYLGVLARWRFFERDSGQWDYRLLYREKDAQGRVSDWVEIPVSEVRTAHHVLWNPGKRSVKILADLASTFAGTAPQPQDLPRSLPYLLLLNVIRHHGISGASAERQFVILRARGGHPAEAPQVLLRSSFHTLT